MAFWQGSSMNASEYKLYHEYFMQNNHGSSALHTFFSIFFTVKCLLFNSVKFRTSTSSEYVFEYVTIVLPLILAHTVLANYLVYLNYLIFALLMQEMYYFYPKLNISKTLNELNYFKTKRIHSVTCLRGLTYLITVFAILAVDFKAFPRNLAKTERYGYSLMDTGVGLFVLMSGLVHKELSRNNLKEIIQSNLKFVSVLIVLGIVRFWSVKTLEYHEHVTEYGVHWNFFFTLAVCKVTSTILLYNSNNPLLFSVVTLIVHEFLLHIGLKSWVFSDTPRTNLLSANREGISSCLGYTSLYLFAAYVRKELNNKTTKRLFVLMKFVISTIVLWCMTHIVNEYKPTSRTLANSAYCIFLCATFITILCIIYFIEVLYQDVNEKLGFKVPEIVSAINHNGLIIFLISNLLTGAINLSIRTLFVSNLLTFLILNCYMILIVILAVYLKTKGIKI